MGRVAVYPPTALSAVGQLTALHQLGPNDIPADAK
jgi:hypothetical protein